jgi:hypothetical protein
MAAVVRTSDDVQVRRTILSITPNKFFQHLMTVMTGKALPGQKSILKLKELPDFVTQIPLISVGIFATVGCLSFGMPLLATVPMLITTGRMRYLQVIVGHNAVHRQVFKTLKANDALIDCISGFLCIASSKDYVPEHLDHHKPTIFSSIKDGDAAFLRLLGFRAGMSREFYWKHLIKTIFSPKFHAIFLKARFKSMWGGGWLNRMCFGLSMTGVLGFTALFGAAAAALALIVPATIMYNISALLQFISEHEWHPDDAAKRLSREEIASRSHGRFCGEAFPINGNIINKTIWTFKMVCIHLPVRLWVLVGDLNVHDYHHLGAGRRPSTELIFAREQAIQDGDPHGMASREYWGLFAVIDHIFKKLAEQDPLNSEEVQQSNAAIA